MAALIALMAGLPFSNHHGCFDCFDLGSRVQHSNMAALMLGLLFSNRHGCFDCFDVGFPVELFFIELYTLCFRSRGGDLRRQQQRASQLAAETSENHVRLHFQKETLCRPHRLGALAPPFSPQPALSLAAGG